MNAMWLRGLCSRMLGASLHFWRNPTAAAILWPLAAWRRHVLELRRRGELLTSAASVGDAFECARLLRQRIGFRYCTRASRIAADAGHVDCLRLLIPRSKPNAQDSHALAFAAAKGRLECVKLLIPVSRISSAKMQPLFLAAAGGHAECVTLLIPVSNAKNRILALFRAAGEGRLDCVKLLAPTANQNDLAKALCFAVDEGRIECAKFLAPLCNSQSDYCSALRNAAIHGHADCLTLLISTFQPNAEYSKILCSAASRGQAECVNVLLALVDPSADDHRALRHAVIAGHLESARLLLPDNTAPLPAGIFSQALLSGSVDLAAMLLAREPALMDHVDLPMAFGHAVQNGHKDLALLLSTAIESRALSTVAKSGHLGSHARKASRL